MSADRMVLAMGIGMLAASAVLGVRAGWYFVHNDIRGVWDDLAGRARQRGVAASMREAPRARHVSRGLDALFSLDADEATTVVEEASRAASGASFAVLRRELVVHSDEVISIGEEW